MSDFEKIINNVYAALVSFFNKFVELFKNLFQGAKDLVATTAAPEA